ncbi:MAG TPA: CHAT domain-containing tetratricopeptide repeat protein [Stellaceae bacterium]|nr:CHAT domain-containing tetratricopeptide repeat protein [Stellaceae bacterium]
MKAVLHIAIAALVLLVGGAAARAQEPEDSPLGQTLAGEACAWKKPPVVALVAGEWRELTIACGTDTANAGKLWIMKQPDTLPAAGPEREAAIVSIARSTPGVLGGSVPSKCEPPHEVTPDHENLLIFCELQSVGWPRIALVTVAGGAIYEAEGLPALLPVLQTAIGTLANRPASAADTEAAIRLVESRFPGTVAHGGDADVAAYKALAELGRSDAAAQDYAGAEAAYRRTLDIEIKLFGANSLSVGEALIELALQVSNQGRFDEANALFIRAEPILNAAPDPVARARLASYQALNEANQRHFADALKYAHAAADMWRAQIKSAESGGVPAAATMVWNEGELTHSLLIEAAMALRLDDLPTALAAASEALRNIDDEPGLPLWWRPQAVMTMAEIDSRSERVVPAEREFTDAVAMDRKLFGDTAPTAFAEMRLGKFYAGQQVYAPAIDAFRRAFPVLSRDEVARAAVVPDQIIPFLTAAGAVAGQTPAERAKLDDEAFRASQLIGATVLGQTIARAAARRAADTPALEELLHDTNEAERHRDSLRMTIAAETAKPDISRNPAHERDLVAELQASSVLYDQLTARVRHEFPDYAALADPGPASLADVQKQLRPDEGFLFYIVGNDGAFALLVTSNDLTMRPLDTTRSDLEKEVTDLRAAFVPQLGRLPDFDTSLSYDLYRRILEPLEPKLRGIDRLEIAPSGALASLPLSLLVTAPPAAGAETAWLVRRMAISETPSARAFLALRAAATSGQQAPKPILAIGDPAFTGVGPRPDASGASALGALAGRCRENGPMPAELIRALPPLPETAGEVTTIAHLLGGGSGDVLTGTGATEADFRAHAPGQYRVLYFATHGLLPGELHCQAEPSLVLSPPPTPARSTDDDGLLEAGEIAGMKINADLVVLSACNTAEGGGHFGGEALSGLATAFFTAGAHAVLASHWEVPSLATVKLMTGLFQIEARDPTTGFAEALRQSQLALLAQPATAHPYYWAAFSLIGDTGAADRTAAMPQKPSTDQAERGPI